MEPHYTYGIPIESYRKQLGYSQELVEILSSGIIMPKRKDNLIRVAEATAMDEHMKKERGFQSFFDQYVLGNYALVLDREKLEQKPIYPRAQEFDYFIDEVNFRGPLVINDSLIAVGIPLDHLKASCSSEDVLRLNFLFIESLTKGTNKDIKIVDSSQPDFQDLSPKKLAKSEIFYGKF